MQIKDYLVTEEPTFENRLLYAQLMDPYDCNCDSKYGYIDGAKECLETYRPVGELGSYISKYEIENNMKDDYEKSYVQAYRDYIKQEKKEGVTNE